MHWFYLPPSEFRRSTLSLTGREAHHALHVLRVRDGDIVTVLDGEGRVLLCKAAGAKRDQLSLEIVEQRSSPPPPYKVTLAQAIPKGKLFEDIIQKATELGASRIVPLLTERVVAKPPSDETVHKVEKWTQVAIEAIKQCGSPWLPKIEPPMPIGDFLTLKPVPDLAFVGSLARDSQHPRHYFQEFTRTSVKNLESVSVAIGPEGDFTPQELSTLQSAGWIPITLGPLVLRTETAAVYCLSIINYELQAQY
jgi:16S rRNA (uracil1498-N3)-methyltransferase